MATINLVNSLVGGTGKSVFCSLLYEYFCQPHVNIEVELIDTDRVNPDVGRKYFPTEYLNGPKLYFSENPKEADKSDLIYEKALLTDLLINLSGDSSIAFSNWLLKNRILDLKQVNFVNWFVCDGSDKSIRAFKNFVNKYQDSMTHILVKNSRTESGWNCSEDREGLELSREIASYKIKTIKIPYLVDMSQIEYLKEPFYSAIDSSNLQLVESQRTKVFLRESFKAIAQV